MPYTPNRKRLISSEGFTLLEILVVVAIILILAAIAFPVYTTVRARSNQVIALNNMRQLTAAGLTFAAQNDQTLPGEDASKQDSWQAASDPANEKVWYNALPRLVGKKGVADYAAAPREYYTPSNLLFLPGATYPESDKKLTDPLFAIAINSRLQRKDKEHQTKGPVRLSQITHPARTAFFFEQGLKSEKESSGRNSKYDGAPKGTAKTFVARYGGKGVITFCDGSASLYAPKDLLKENGDLPFPQTDVVWSRMPEDDPN